MTFVTSKIKVNKGDLVIIKTSITGIAIAKGIVDNVDYGYLTLEGLSETKYDYSKFYILKDDDFVKEYKHIVHCIDDYECEDGYVFSVVNSGKIKKSSKYIDDILKFLQDDYINSLDLNDSYFNSFTEYLNENIIVKRIKYKFED